VCFLQHRRREKRGVSAGSEEIGYIVAPSFCTGFYLSKKKRGEESIYTVEEEEEAKNRNASCQEKKKPATEKKKPSSRHHRTEMEEISRRS